VFDDLESQAGALFAQERDLELADRARSEYASVTLASRLMASVGRSLLLDVEGVGQIRGDLRRATGSWSLLEGHRQEWIVSHASLTSVVGASTRSVPEAAWSALARLGLGSALRRLADEQMACVIRLRDGAAHRVVPQRIGHDFVEAADPSGHRRLLALAAVAAVQSRDDIVEV
jgi:hypothetical protein